MKKPAEAGLRVGAPLGRALNVKACAIKSFAVSNNFNFEPTGTANLEWAQKCHQLDIVGFAIRRWGRREGYHMSKIFFT